MTIKPEKRSSQSVVDMEAGGGAASGSGSGGGSAAGGEGSSNNPDAAVLAKTSIKTSIRIPSLVILTYFLILSPIFSQVLCPLPTYARGEPRSVPLKTTNALDDSFMTAQVSGCNRGASSVSRRDNIRQLLLSSCSNLASSSRRYWGAPVVKSSRVQSRRMRRPSRLVARDSMT